MTNITITSIKVSEVALLAQIAKETYLDHYPPIWEDGGAWYVSKVYNETQLLSEILDENVSYFLVFQAQKVIGFIKLKIDYPLSKNGTGLAFGQGEGSSVALENALYLERIYFLKSATGKGLGNHCFQFIENYAREKGKTALWLMAMDWSVKALHFYEKQGFSMCGTWQLDFNLMKKECRGMVILKKELIF